MSEGRPPGRYPARQRRDRHGRGMRGPLAPAVLPLSRTRAEQFDDRVLDAVEHLERRWSRELEGVEFAVEDVPQVGRGQGWTDSGTDSETYDGDTYDSDTYDGDTLEDGAVPLARVLRARMENGTRMAPRIVIYRRPLEARAVDPADLDDIVHDIVVEQVARLLGVSPEEVDPPE